MLWCPWCFWHFTCIGGISSTWSTKLLASHRKSIACYDCMYWQSIKKYTIWFVYFIKKWRVTFTVSNIQSGQCCLIHSLDSLISSHWWFTHKWSLLKESIYTGSHYALCIHFWMLCWTVLCWLSPKEWKWISKGTLKFKKWSTCFSWAQENTWCIQEIESCTRKRYV